MPIKDEEKEVFGSKGTEKHIERMLEEQEIKPDIIEKIKIELNVKYREQINAFKKDYNIYQQSGRYFTSTRMRLIKKGDWVCFIDLEADILIIEKVLYSDGKSIQSKSYEYPVALTKTIEMSPKLFSIRRKKTIIHLCIANTYALNISNHIKNLSDSVFLRTILKYRDKRKLSEKPIFQLFIGGFIFGIIAYFVLIKVFEKAIVYMIGNFTIIPPAK